MPMRIILSTWELKKKKKKDPKEKARMELRSH